MRCRPYTKALGKCLKLYERKYFSLISNMTLGFNNGIKYNFIALDYRHRTLKFHLLIRYSLEITEKFIIIYKISVRVLSRNT